MTITDKKAANAMGGKTARPCDGCLHKRARWYCVADDAFLCQSCDTSVHSANPLASRHERVRLETASSSSSSKFNAPSASWHQGFTRKARTPRQNKQQKGTVGLISRIDPLVPEVGSEEGSPSVDEQTVCRVPVFNPEELCELDDGLHGFLPSDLDLAEFERLLEVGHDEDSRGIKVEQQEEDGIGASFFEPDFDVTRASLNWSFDDDESPMNTEVEEKVVPVMSETKTNKLLSLNYESVITAWASQGSPWTTGTRPEFDPVDFMGSNPIDDHHLNGGIGGILYMRARGNSNTDGEREARVSRYREKRRTRLFSKKIRYQVRKLNAEKRPRMKGRFVKRTAFVGLGSTDFPYVNSHC